MRVVTVGLCLLCACAGSQALTTSGQAVRVAQESEVAGCEFLQFIAVEWGNNARGRETNMANATNDIRNRAATLQATHVLLGSPGEGTSMTGGDCPNCVTLEGEAYRCEAAATN